MNEVVDDLPGGNHVEANDPVKQTENRGVFSVILTFPRSSQFDTPPIRWSPPPRVTTVRPLYR